LPAAATTMMPCGAHLVVDILLINQIRIVEELGRSGKTQVDDIGLLGRHCPGNVFEARRVTHRLHNVPVITVATFAEGPDRHDARAPAGPGDPRAVVRLRGDGAGHVAAVENAGPGVLGPGVTGVGVDVRRRPKRSRGR
jgi:hypothetical protein